MLAGPVVARAQAPAPPDAPAARIVLRELATTVGPAVGLDDIAWRVVVEHRGVPVPGGAAVPAAGAWERVDVVAELRAAVSGPEQLAAALAGVDATPVLRQRSVALTPRGLDPGAVGIAEGAVPLRGLAPAGDPGGVHPLRLRVVADGREVARLDTAVVRLERLPAPASALAVVWPLTHPPLLATGSAAEDAAERAALATAVAPGGRLRTTLAALTAADPALAAAVALAPAAHLVEDLAALADDGDAAGAADAAAVLAQLRALAAGGRAGPLITPYAGVDLARLLGAGAGAGPDAAEVTARLAAAAADEGGRRLLPLLGRSPAPVTLIDGPTSLRALDLVERLVVVPAGTVTDVPPGSAGSAAVRRTTAASGRIVTLVVADTGLTAALAGLSAPAAAARPGGPVAAAQDVVVRAAALLLTAPADAGPAAGPAAGSGAPAAVLLPPSDLDPDPDALAELLSRLAGAAWLTPVTPAALAAEAGAGTRPRTGPVGTLPAAPSRLVAALTAGDLALRTTTATVDAAALDGPLVLAGRTPRDLDDMLLRAAGAGLAAPAGTDPSGALADRAERALAAAKGVRETAERAVGPVVIAVGDLTLTDGRGPLPLTVDGGGALPLRLTVELAGPAALEWPLGTRWDVLLPVDADVALQVPVAARATGVFPVTVLVLDAGGGVLAEATVAVRATELAGPALLGIGVAVAGMTAVGLVRQRRRMRRRRA